jgi:hypothetical protein
MPRKGVKAMMLLTKALEKRFAEVGRQDVKDPVIITKFFNPTGRGTWYAVAYDPKEKLFFGYVSIFGDFCDEWGYFSLAELESWKCLWGLGIERDLYWTEKKASEVPEIQ